MNNDDDFINLEWIHWSVCVMSFGFSQHPFWGSNKQNEVPLRMNWFQFIPPFSPIIKPNMNNSWLTYVFYFTISHTLGLFCFCSGDDDNKNAYTCSLWLMLTICIYMTNVWFEQNENHAYKIKTKKKLTLRHTF